MSRCLLAFLRLSVLLKLKYAEFWKFIIEFLGGWVEEFWRFCKMNLCLMFSLSQTFDSVVYAFALGQFT
jgi:hypothetical protein